MKITLSKSVLAISKSVLAISESVLAIFKSVLAITKSVLRNSIARTLSRPLPFYIISGLYGIIGAPSPPWRPVHVQKSMIP